MAKNFTMTQLKQLLNIHENIIIKICTNRFEKLELKITGIQEENNEMKREVKEWRTEALQESTKFQDEIYEKYMKE